MRQRVEICGDGNNRLCFDVAGYENEDAATTDDANWLQCLVEVSNESFTGVQHCALMTHDFDALQKALAELLHGQGRDAAFSTDEGWVEFNMAKEATGAVHVSGTLRGGIDLKTALKFFFDTDLSSLEAPLAELGVLLETYPVKD